MTTYALIHGGIHGGWCWEHVVPELEARGHRTIAPDLPFEDPEAGAREWAAVVVDALDAVHATDDVVVVGHSMGGLATPVVASMRPVRHMVFLCAMVPVPGRSYNDVLAEESGAVTFPRDLGGEPGPAGISWEAARAGFYDTSPEPLARAAFERLRPMHAAVVHAERCPIDAWPAVPSTSVLARGDRAVGPEWSRAVARGRLGAHLVEIDGDHSPFLGRPAELAALLDAV